jgi:hypothetical protein
MAPFIGFTHRLSDRAGQPPNTFKRPMNPKGYRRRTGYEELVTFGLAALCWTLFLQLPRKGVMSEAREVLTNAVYSFGVWRPRA